MPNFNTRPHAQALILLFIAMISMQGSGSLAKILFGQFSVMTVSVMRLMLGALILALLQFRHPLLNFRLAQRLYSFRSSCRHRSALISPARRRA